jgi:sulfur-oxidizing protein SoxA
MFHPAVVVLTIYRLLTTGTMTRDGENPVGFRVLLMAACFACLATSHAIAQGSETEKAIEKYRQMLKEDPWSNPGLLDADRGEALWTTARGPKNVTLEQCDLGKGAGKVDGAFAELPRYFADADRVMDLETRILWCMEHLQGFSRGELVRRPYPAAGQPVKELGAVATYVATKSNGMHLSAKLQHPKEREAVALGEALFFRRSGPFDFGCLTCHGAQGLRIRLQALPQLSNPEEARKILGEWPAYRVSNTHVMTMQHRLYDCYWQMRMPELELGSDVSVALIAYLVSKAQGGEITVPGLKR